MTLDKRLRWLAMLVLCLGDLMIVLDITIVNVALPSIRGELEFTEASLAWVVNAYTLTFGGFLLLSGRLGDIYGPRRLFIIGVALFTLASLGCGLANSQLVLILARGVQGFAGAVVSAVALSLIISLFQAPEERAQAMGVFGFVSAGGGSIGVLLGGLLTQILNWHWIFLVNLPVGILVLAACARLLPPEIDQRSTGKLDIGGAVTVTSALLLAVYAIINGNEAGWLSVETLGLLAASFGFLVLFLVIEAKVEAPLAPLEMFARRSLALSNVIGMLWAAAMFAAFFLTALYLQAVLGYRPLEIGLAFLPTNIIMAAFSLGLSARLVMRFGVRTPVAGGLLAIAIGLALLARTPVDATFVRDILPSMVLQGLGAGIALNPLLLAAMNDVEPGQSGLASGLVNTAFMMGGALGLAILASLAAAWTSSAVADGAAHVAALSIGYKAAFLAGALIALAAAGLALLLPRERSTAEEMRPAAVRD